MLSKTTGLIKESTSVHFTSAVVYVTHNWYIRFTYPHQSGSLSFLSCMFFLHACCMHALATTLLHRVISSAKPSKFMLYCTYKISHALCTTLIMYTDPLLPPCSPAFPPNPLFLLVVVRLHGTHCASC